VFFIFGPDFGITPLSHCQAQRRKKTIAESAEVKEIRLHDFRHSCASLLINVGTPITTVSKYMRSCQCNKNIKYLFSYV